MTNKDEQLIADYMGWKSESFYISASPILAYCRDREDGFEPFYIVNFDSNDASLCVQEMQKRGEWEYFVGDTEDTLIYTRYHKEHHSYKSFLVAWLFNAENFFAAMAQWLKERGK